MRGLPVLLLLWLVAPAAAQTVAVRSGDHAEFARLVIDLPADRAWALGRTGQDYALDLGPGLDLDISRVFDRIPRNRLSDIEVDAETGRVLLRLACPCHANAFPFGPDKLVIDVIDGPPPAGSPFEAALATPPAPAPAPAPTPATAPPAAGPALQAAGQTPGETPGATPGRPSLAALPLIAAPLPLPPPLPLDLVLPRSASPEQEAAALATPPEEPLDGLAADMARAVAAGILDAPAGTPALAPEAAAPAPDGAPPAGPGAFALAEDAAGPGVSFIPADRLERTVAGARELSRTGVPCRPESDFDLAAWSETGDFARDVGALRRNVIDAAGAVDTPALTALARTYLHFGFGAEARQTLALGGEESTSTRLLRLIADLLDGRPVPPGVLADQVGCLTPVALWSALARGTLEGSTLEERTAIEAAFRVLPPGPRHAIAPRLAALFLAAGQSGAATAILDRMPAQGAATEEAIGVQSDVIREASSAVAARDALLAAIRNGTRASAGTMLRLVDATLEAGLPVEPWMTETLATLRFEYRETDIAGPLAEAEIRALTASDSFAEARARLVDPAIGLAAEARGRLAEDLALALARRGSDTAVLDFAFAQPARLPGGAAANALAGRLIGLGFPDVALDLLTPAAPPEAMGERRELRASALRALGQDEEAARVLAGMADPATGTPDATAAWRAGDWDALTAAEDPLLTAAAAAVLDDADRPEGDNSLAGRAALIGAAEETRRLAEALLQRFPAPGPGQPLPQRTQ